MQCAFCESQIYIDKSGAGFFYVLPYQLDVNAANGVFRRWAAGSDKAKDLESTSRVVATTGSYFPIFMFRRDLDGRENVYVEPAKSTTLPGLHSLKVPPGDLKVFDQKYDFAGVDLEQPNIEMVAYLDKLPGEA
ncbi:MAG: zinc ribbon domain-containing protein, partial [Thermoplasmata archaeon]|nr:zinc ribbon domain-containing protein [Thermoplasmata archaeon]